MGAWPLEPFGQITRKQGGGRGGRLDKERPPIFIDNACATFKYVEAKHGNKEKLSLATGEDRQIMNRSNNIR